MSQWNPLPAAMRAMVPSLEVPTQRERERECGQLLRQRTTDLNPLARMGGSRLAHIRRRVPGSRSPAS